MSSLYRQTPSETQPTDAQVQLRIDRRLQRLVATYGGTEVRRCIRESAGENHVKAMLVLRALTA